MKAVYISTLLALSFATLTNAYAAESTLSVTCRGNDVGAEVLVNGKFKGECPVDVLVPEGRLNLKVQKEVDASTVRLFEQEIRIGDNVTKTVNVVLGAPQPKVGKPHAQDLTRDEMKKGSVLSITCRTDEMNADVYVDGTHRGTCPVDVRVSEGTSKLRVQKKVDAFNERIFEQEVRVGDGVVKNIVVQLDVLQPNTAIQQAKPEQAEVKTGKFQDCKYCPEMVVIPAGSFDMGSPDHEAGRNVDEGPVHRVTLPSFAMSETEVTRAQFAVFVHETKHDLGDCWAVNEYGWINPAGRSSDLAVEVSLDNRPVSCVNWFDAQAYVQWLAKKTGKTYRLPTESEWEYAARAGTTTARYWGDDVGQNNANCSDCVHKWDAATNPWEGEQASPVASFKPNAFGLYDMLGNVWEWTEDTYHSNYKGAPADGSAWVQKTAGNERVVGRVIRGGSFKNHSLFMRSAFRMGIEPIKRYDYRFGIRVVRSLP